MIFVCVQCQCVFYFGGGRFYLMCVVLCLSVLCYGARCLDLFMLYPEAAGSLGFSPHCCSLLVMCIQ